MVFGKYGTGYDRHHLLRSGTANAHLCFKTNLLPLGSELAGEVRLLGCGCALPSGYRILYGQIWSLEIKYARSALHRCRQRIIGEVGYPKDRISAGKFTMATKASLSGARRA